MKTPLKTVLGPLWKIFNDPTTSEILVDAHDDVYWSIWKDNAITFGQNNKVFKTPAELDALVDRLLKFTKMKTGEHSYYLTLDDVTRVNISLPPLSVRGPAINIMKIPNQNFTLGDLVKWNVIDEKGKSYLEKTLESHKGILVAGISGSGKTTLLNILLNSLALPQRVVTLEHAAELMIHRPFVHRLRAPTGKNSEMPMVVEAAQKSRADWFVIDYLSGPEVMPYIELLRDTATGMGCVTGENVFDALKRLETKALLSSEGQSLEDVRYAIAQAFPVIVVQERRANNKRVISQIAEVCFESGELKLNFIHKS